MTLPIEEKRATAMTEQFLYRLLDPQRSPRVPLWARKEARMLLKHFPVEHRRDEIWGEDE